MEAQPDLAQLTDAELKDKIRLLVEEEREISMRGGCSTAASSSEEEMVAASSGRDEGELSVVDVEALSRILAGRLPDIDRLEGDGATRPGRSGESGCMPRCGFHNSDAHKYCGRCGALLIVENQGTGEITGALGVSPTRSPRPGPGRARRSTAPRWPSARAARPGRSSRSTATP